MICFGNDKNKDTAVKRGQLFLALLLCFALFLSSLVFIQTVYADPLEETSATENTGEPQTEADSETTTLSEWEKEQSRIAEASESASVESSIEESKSIAASEAESIFASMSEEAERQARIESEEYENTHIRVGKYAILTDLNPAAAQEGFEIRVDSTTFDKTTDVFFQKDYLVSVYYATDGEEYGFYCYDQMTGTLYPYTTLNLNDDTYVVVTPVSEDIIPGTFITDTTISIQSYSKSNYNVPAYKIMDGKKNPILLVMLKDKNGLSDFYVYDDTSGFLKLTLYTDYAKELTSVKAVTTQTKTVQTKAVVTTEAPESKSVFDNYVVWLVIIGIVIVLLIVAVVVVIFLNKRQDAEEEEIDFEEDELKSPYEFLKQKRMMTSGYNSEQEDVESFDVNFENSFPDEMEIEEDSTIEEEEKRLNELMDLEDQAILEPDDYEEEDEPQKPAVNENTQQVDFDRMRQEVSRFKQDDQEIKDTSEKKILSENDFDKINF